MHEPLTFAEYSREHARSTVMRTQNTETLAFAALGLAGETNEARLVLVSETLVDAGIPAARISEHVKRILREDGGALSPERAARIEAEAGDMLWYLERIAQLAGTTLEAIARKNLDKARGRVERGTVCGEGDDR